MGKLYLFLLLLPLQYPLMGQDTPSFSIEILDNEALRFLDENTEITVVGKGFTWTEGPLWIEDGKFLLFSDIPRNTVFKMDSIGKISEYLKPSGFLGEDFKGEEPGSNGLVLSPEGKLVLMQHGERRVALMKSTLDKPKPEYEVLADRYEGRRLNSPNDGTYDEKGNLYFTDPPYGLPLQMDDPQKELDFQGVYCLKPSGELILLDKLSRPNGIAFSPDYSKLYIAVSNPQHAVWYEYDVITEAKIANKRIFYNATALIGNEGEQGLPDGMKMHSSGYLFATGPGGLWIFNQAGKPIARIHTGEKTSNCAFTPDEKTLFLTADDYILKVGLK
jgi:gluconolactonase